MTLQIATWCMALIYGAGASVHLGNILGLTGTPWRETPTKWQALDVVYLSLDVIVVAGLLAAPRVGIAALVVAAVSQIVLYSVGRDWILDVPWVFRPDAAGERALDQLVAFHVLTLAGLLALAATVVWARS